jgi:transcriptional regulator with XRE-family HTH domain
MTSLGERILILRRRRGLTQRELAAATGLNTNTIARVERGEVKDLIGQSIANLARVLETTTDFLLGASDEPDRPGAQDTELLPTAVALVGA